MERNFAAQEKCRAASCFWLLESAHSHVWMGLGSPAFRFHCSSGRKLSYLWPNLPCETVLKTDIQNGTPQQTDKPLHCTQHLSLSWSGKQPSGWRNSSSRIPIGLSRLGATLESIVSLWRRRPCSRKWLFLQSQYIPHSLQDSELGQANGDWRRKQSPGTDLSIPALPRPSPY